MFCPYCHGEETRVVDKRDNNDTGVTRRRRECLSCRKRFTTYERIETICLNVEKRSSKIEEFDREKLKKGIMKAVKKRPITENTIDELIDDIELKLLNRKSNIIKTSEIGKMVLTRLKKIDKVGYLLFASVYNDFNSINEFEQALIHLKDNSN
ncbi:transcriptional repressor NrdR [Candidatus Dojkabacteria bacterium]|uniref:Transcriptional repressor NrdR n=1 Tax=Candidatus Dojkabacteria bacterium TaxID=2099670 RepID=A0A955L6U9_9BACT|nr:transcriptional repressor NrdR [Candidatus Dojkabacteria bacterium]